MVELVALLRVRGEVEEEAYTLVPLSCNEAGQGAGGGLTPRAGEPMALITFRFAGETVCGE